MRKKAFILVGVIAIVTVVAGVIAFVLLGQPKEKIFQLTAREFAFNGLGYNDFKGGPTLRIKVGDTVKIVLRNEGGIKHELMVVSEHDLKKALEAEPKGKKHKHPKPIFAGALIHNLEPGQEKEVSFVAEKPGTYIYACFLEYPENHAKLGMFGKLIVEQ